MVKDCTELLRGADGTQPSSSLTNRMCAAAGSRGGAKFQKG
jgi:hypothetical protein